MFSFVKSINNIIEYKSKTPVNKSVCVLEICVIIPASDENIKIAHSLFLMDIVILSKKDHMPTIPNQKLKNSKAPKPISFFVRE